MHGAVDEHTGSPLGMLCLRAPSGLTVRLRDGSNTLGRGPYTGIQDERVSRKQLCLFVTQAGTVVAVCVGRNPCSVRLSEGARPSLLQVRSPNRVDS